MSSLKDQLKEWKAELGEELADDGRPGAKAPRAEVEPDAEPEPEAEPELTDEELFLQAISKVDDDAAAVLAKYDRTKAPRKAADAPDGDRSTSEKSLFLQYVGEMKPGDDKG